MVECGPCPVFASFTLTFALQLRKKHGKTSVRIRKTSVRLRKTSVRLSKTSVTVQYTYYQKHPHITKPLVLCDILGRRILVERKIRYLGKHTSLSQCNTLDTGRMYVACSKSIRRDFFPTKTNEARELCCGREMESTLCTYVFFSPRQQTASVACSQRMSESI